MTRHELQALRQVADLGPAGGRIVRHPIHSQLRDLGLIELGNRHATVTGEGLDALAKARG